MTHSSHDASRVGAGWEVACLAAAMTAFALVSHRGGAWLLLASACLLGSSALIARSVRGGPRVLAAFGLEKTGLRVMSWAIAGILIGSLGAAGYRSLPGAVPDPGGGVQHFVIVACLIGITEELVYRGWLMGRALVFGRTFAVVVAAAAHTAYKTALFAWPPDGPAHAIDLHAIILWTFVGGIVLGILRTVSRSTLPPAVAHATFDLIVYASFAAAPWWVWS